MIQHTVVFRLHHKAGTEGERAFLAKASELRLLPGVLDFKVLRQVSVKNNFEWGLSMLFSSQHSYDAYNEHPEHVHFVETVWLPQVAEFMEIDYTEHLQLLEQ